MRSGPVGVGIVGAGTISDEYLSNLSRYPDVRLRFVADLDRDRAAAQAAKYGVPRSGSVDALLDDDEVEVVVNLTIPAAHVEIAERAVRAGKHVWSEKPVAMDRHSGARLLSAASVAGTRVACAPDTFLGAGTQTALRLLRDGAVGAPSSAIVLYQSGGPESWHPNPDFLYQPGGGPLFDIGPYYLTVLTQVLGPVIRVAGSASAAKVTRTIATGPRAGEEFPVLVPTHVGALLQFAGGGSAHCVFSFDSALVRSGFIEITGDSGTVALPNPNRFDGETRVWTAAGTDPGVRPPVGAPGGRGIGVVELARAIRAGTPERASGELAFHILDVMVAILESADSGRSIDVSSGFEPGAVLPEGWDPADRTL